MGKCHNRNSQPRNTFYCFFFGSFFLHIQLFVTSTCTVHLQEEILPSSTVEDSCTVYVTEEDAQMEYTDIKGEYLISNNI